MALNFTVDARDGGLSASAVSCASCCCESITLRPGETNLMVINYAPWSLPIGVLVPTMQFDIEVNTDACPTNYPTNTDYSFQGAAAANIAIDLSTNAANGTAPYTYKIVSLTGPDFGTIDYGANATNGPVFTYVPNSGFTGFDYFDYEMTDANGQTFRGTVEIDAGIVGTGHNQVQDVKRLINTPYIDASVIQINQDLHTVSFPIHMPTSVTECEQFRLTIKQPAQDCNRTVFHHFACFDIVSKDCG